MTQAVIDHRVSRHGSWSWRWFVIGSSTTLELLVLGVVLWAFVGQWWVGGVVAAVFAVSAGWFAHHAGRGRLPAYLIGTAMALVVTYGAISVAVGVYLQHYYS